MKFSLKMAVIAPPESPKLFVKATINSFKFYLSVKDIERTLVIHEMDSFGE